MTFKEFLQLDELEGQFGAVKTHAGPLQLIKTMTKMAQMPKQSGSPVKRAVSGSLGPARPVKVTTVNGPMTKPSILNL
jgi:hypothetical protein